MDYQPYLELIHILFHHTYCTAALWSAVVLQYSKMHSDTAEPFNLSVSFVETATVVKSAVITVYVTNK